ncbi:MAG: hypothetical protein ABMB14_15560 [Myxococcota bacterium]
MDDDEPDQVDLTPAGAGRAIRQSVWIDGQNSMITLELLDGDRVVATPVARAPWSVSWALCDAGLAVVDDALELRVIELQRGACTARLDLVAALDELDSDRHDYGVEPIRVDADHLVIDVRAEGALRIDPRTGGWTWEPAVPIDRSVRLDTGAPVVGVVDAGPALLCLTTRGLLAAAHDAALELWSVDGPIRRIAQTTLGDPIVACTFDPTGERLWVAAGHRLVVLDGALTVVFGADPGLRTVSEIAFVDGTLHVRGEAGRGEFRTVRGGTAGQRLPGQAPPPLEAATRHPRHDLPGLAGGRWLTDAITLTFHRGEVVVRDEEAAKRVGGWQARIATWRLGEPPPPIVVSLLEGLAPTERWRAWIAVGVDDRCELWDLRTGARVAALAPVDPLVPGFAVDPSARWAVACTAPLTVLRLDG